MSYTEHTEHKIAIDPDKLFETISYLNDYFNRERRGNNIIIEFKLPLKRFYKDIHFIKIKGDPYVINDFIKHEFLKQNKD